MEDPTIIEGKATEEKVYTKDPIPSARPITNQSDSETRKYKSIQSPHLKNIFGPVNQAAMTPEDQNDAIWEAFSNDDYLPQEPYLKQALC